MNPSILIRFAMLSGVLLFGGAIWFMRNNGQAPAFETTADTVTLLVWIGRFVWGLSLAGSMVLFAFIQRAATPARTQTFSIIAWALSEAVALYGGVVWYLTGQNQWWVSGVILLVLSFLAFPGGRMAPGRRA